MQADNGALWNDIVNALEGTVLQQYDNTEPQICCKAKTMHEQKHAHCNLSGKIYAFGKGHISGKDDVSGEGRVSGKNNVSDAGPSGATASAKSSDPLTTADDYIPCDDFQFAVPKQPACRRSSSSSTSSSRYSSSSGDSTAICARSLSNSNYKLSDAERAHVLQVYSSIPKEKKWALASGAIVEDQMKQLAVASQYEHPVHSYILDPADSLWQRKMYFSPEDIPEIIEYKAKPLPPLSSDLQSCIDDFYTKCGPLVLTCSNILKA
ncbi:hypothetical protein MBANPS3_002157 [Mucor bainieri]